MAEGRGRISYSPTSKLSSAPAVSATSHDPLMRRTSVILALLALAFLGRVAGQVIVMLFAPSWLPPMSEWYSGLLPYPLLLPTQIVILVLQAWISPDLWRGTGRFAERWPRFGVGLRWFSFVYFAVMVLRYVLTMALVPERRWFVGTIPIFFHYVLAAYLFTWSRFHESKASRPSD